jgi:exoribonuclease R
LQELRESIDMLMAVARGLKARRVKSGALELESVEVQVQLSETKSIENLNPKEVMIWKIMFYCW